MRLAGLKPLTITESTVAEDDLRLVELARVNPRAFSALYHRYLDPIYLYCHRHLRNAADAEDATSLVFAKAFEALPRFQPRPRDHGSTFRAWLYTIARHVVIDAQRRRRPQVSVDALGPDSPVLQDPAPSLEDRAVQMQEVEELHMLLDQLPERQRAVIDLRLSGLSGPEIATALGLSVSAVKSLQVRAFRAIRAEFDRYQQLDGDADA